MRAKKNALWKGTTAARRRKIKLTQARDSWKLWRMRRARGRKLVVVVL
jgi:hypothetical protein